MIRLYAILESQALPLSIRSEKQKQWRLKRGWKEGLKNVTGGCNLELIESLCYGTKGDDTGQRRGHF